MKKRMGLSSPGDGTVLGNWKFLTACTLGCGLSTAVMTTYSIGAFVKPLEADLGWSRVQIQAAIFFGAGLTAISGLVAASMIERLGMRRTAIIGFVGTAIGYLMAAFSHSLIYFYASYSVAAILGAGSTMVTWTRAISEKFDRRRGFALALTLCGTGIAGSLLPLTLVTTIASHGWRAGYVVLAAAPLAVALPLTLLFFHPDKTQRGSPGESPGRATAQLIGLSRREALASYRFWVLFISVVALTLASNGIVSNLIPSLTEAGYSSVSASLVQGTFAAAVVFGRLCVGLLMDRFWGPGVAAAILLLPVGGCILMLSAPSLQLATVAAALIGTATGAEVDVFALLASRYFGIRHFASIFALLYASLAISGGSGPALFASIYERTGNYKASFAVSAVLFALGGPILLTLGRYPVLAGPTPVESNLHPHPVLSE